jgi:hypothetical protein
VITLSRQRLGRSVRVGIHPFEGLRLKLKIGIKPKKSRQEIAPKPRTPNTDLEVVCFCGRQA